MREVDLTIPPAKLLPLLAGFYFWSDFASDLTDHLHYITDH